MSTLSKNIKENEEVQENVAKVDFKMVTFSLAGKEYGIDIMKVKEIAKDNVFTFVPNSASYVRGVYNLRGDIISIIDLRIMFNLPAEEKKQGELENMIILRLEDRIIGVIVDYTDKVVGINSETIQPPHPLFGDINVKYISGVVEDDNRLYIILDVERIFGKEEPAETVPAIDTGAAAPPEETPEVQEQAISAGKPGKALDLTFISETLATFRGFYVTGLNSDWVYQRFSQWEKERQQDGKSIQLTSVNDADEFLKTFYSPYTVRFFEEEYVERLMALLPDQGGATFSVWNPGCGKGYETYSLACLLREKYPETKLKIWAHDKDLLGISSAPTLLFSENDVPERFKKFLTETPNGYQFTSQIKDTILFEYHDITHENPFPPVDLVFARDTFSFLNKEDQERIINDLEDLLKPNGMVILGQNERLPSPEWVPVNEGNIVAFKKE